ncbi:kinase-like protein [Rhizophagus irregularis]|uniref:Kinase-like protein n=1 Tax=Rhizophagus irregularis TaxID=588596 RepID=A0A2N0R166_9GLOM|nr:kinase-like protein [Rhizophagus irregularis]
MSNIRMNLIEAALTRAHLLIDYNICVGFHKQYEFCEQKILDDDSLTEEEKTEAIRLNNKGYDRDKITYNLGTRRICENCNQKCLATLYCEYCIRNYLKANFSNWTSGNNDIDDLIKKCQMETNNPAIVIEWIPYNNLENIKYLTKGGFSEIYTAKWIGGQYEEWDSKVQQLVRVGTCNVILKELKNVENASQSWFEEAKSHLTLSNKRSEIVQCYGITQNPSNGNYILVMNKCDINLREYLQQNHNQLTWNERIRIAFEIIDAFDSIHKENSIHRDLHSGNILYSQFYDLWRISDLGFCGPADKPSTSIYGILPYIAPEVIIGRGYTFKSDIYSIAMLMWEISSGQPPFMNYEHDCNLAINIINGMRPKIISEIPSEYKKEQEAFYTSSKKYDFSSISDNSSIFSTISNQYTSINFKNRNEDNDKGSRLFKKLKMENVDVQNDYDEREIMQQQSNIDINDEVQNNPKLHSEEQDEFEIPDDNDSKESPRLSKKLKIENVDVQNDYEREFMQRRSNIGTNDEVQNNPSLHSEQNTKSEILDDES